MAVLTMEVLRRYSRARPGIRGRVFPANPPDPETPDASQDVARVVSDVSVLCPRAAASSGNSASCATFAPSGG